MKRIFSNRKLILKILKKTGLLRFLIFTIETEFNDGKIKIPIIHGLGYPNVFIEYNWISWLIDNLCITAHDTIVDVGANIGQTLISIKTTNKNLPYIGFEPNTICSYYLYEIIKKNNFTDCRIFNVALFDKIQPLLLEKEDDTDPRGSIIQQLRPNYFNKKESVLAIDYDSIQLKENIRLVKVDVEGAEYEVLIGMKQMIQINQPIIVCEVLDSHCESVFDFTQQRATLVCDFLKSQQYSIIQLEQTINGNKIIAFRLIDSIIIKQWTSSSLRENDYIFCPTSKLDSIISLLTSICN